MPIASAPRRTRSCPAPSRGSLPRRSLCANSRRVGRAPWARWFGPPVPPRGTLTLLLQATYHHAPAVSSGWVRAASELGFLKASIQPVAQWGADDVEDDDGLAAYLRRAPPGDTILMMGFDWHSQMLHRSERWRRRWERTRAKRLLYAHESLLAGTRTTGSDEMETAFFSAAGLCDGIVFADVLDRPLVERSGKPSLWLPFGVDTAEFCVATPYGERLPRAFFRGKVELSRSAAEYAQRRRMLAFLQARDLIDLIPFDPGPVEPRDLARDFNRYQVSVNLPSVFVGHPTRVLEGMACGCCVVTNRTGIPEVDGLLEHAVEVLYYDDEEELARLVAGLREDRGWGERIAARGRTAALERFSLSSMVERVMRWAESTIPARTPP